MEYEKKFDEWNLKKKTLNQTIKEKLFINERDIWWTSIGINVGTEIDGKNQKFERPVLILRRLGSEQFIGIPLTSKSKHGVFYIPMHYGNECGVACVSQIRVFSTQRLLRKIGKASETDFHTITSTISRLVGTGRI